MDTDDLRAAIEGPAAQAGLLVEPGLVDLLIAEVDDEPGALALLSHALRTTWWRREGRTLTVAGYTAAGGIRGAVAQTAEAVYDRVPDSQRPVLRDLLLRMVSQADDGGARPPVAWRDRRRRRPRPARRTARRRATGHSLSVGDRGGDVHGGRHLGGRRTARGARPERCSPHPLPGVARAERHTDLPSAATPWSGWSAYSGWSWP